MANIRAARVEDVEGIQQVFYITWLSTYPNEECGITTEDVHDRFKDVMSPERLEKRRRDIGDKASSKQLFVAVVDEQIVGVCRVSKEELHNKLDALYVLPEYQGQGIGTALWKGALIYLGTHKDILVAVATYNTKAIAFYARRGFVDTDRRFIEERLQMKSGSNIPQMEMVLKAEL